MTGSLHFLENFECQFPLLALFGGTDQSGIRYHSGSYSFSFHLFEYLKRLVRYQSLFASTNGSIVGNSSLTCALFFLHETKGQNKNNKNTRYTSNISAHSRKVVNHISMLTIWSSKSKAVLHCPHFSQAEMAEENLKNNLVFKMNKK
jgi:hypothetical protein